MMPLSHSNPSTVHIAGLSHSGTVRTENEDAVYWWHESDQDICFGILADGMGGHKGGALASELSIQTIRSFTRAASEHFQQSLEHLEKIMAAASEAANEAIQQARAEQPEFKDMGTTLVFIGIWNENLIILHAGDSRCYLLPSPLRDQLAQSNRPAYTQLTRDDSVVQSMLDEGVITPEDVPNIPYRNRLTNALGIKSPLVYSLASHKFSEGSSLLICSDGFYQAVSMNDASRLIYDQGVNQKTVEQLIQMSLDNQTNDNTSVILMGFGADAAYVQQAVPSEKHNK
jgi:protein phosphatase